MCQSPSAYVKEFSEEIGSEYAQKLFKACEEGSVTLVTSQWSVGESLASIDRKFRRREITRQQKEMGMLAIISKSVVLAQEGKLRMVPVKEGSVRSSWALISKHHLSADGALQLVSAIIGVSEIFLAADEFLLGAARSAGFECYNIEKDSEARSLLTRLRL